MKTSSNISRKRHNRHSVLILILMCAPVFLLLEGCVTYKVQKRPYLIQENLKHAMMHFQQKRKEEAAQIYQVILFADPHNQEAKLKLGEIGSYSDCFMKPTLMGKSLTPCAKRIGTNWGMKVALYPFNRVLDIMDVVSFHVGLEGGIYANAHITRSAQVGFGAGGGTQLGWWQKRELGAGVSHVAGMALGPFEAVTNTDSRAGTRGADMRSYGISGINRPSAFIYQQNRDFWGIGVRAVAGIVGASVEIHPLELGDAVAGIFFVDYLCDDFGTSKRLKLNTIEIEAMQDLINSMTPPEIRARMRGRMIPPTGDEQEIKPEAKKQKNQTKKVPVSPPPPPQKRKQIKTYP